MIRLSRLADYGVVLMSYIARRGGLLHNAAEIASLTGVPLPTASKTLQALASEGLLRSQRGIKGGYALARPAGEISVAEIIAAVDGPVALTQCIEQGPGVCEIETLCPSRGSWERINEAVTEALERVTLADIATKMPPLPGPGAGAATETLAT